MGLSSSGESGKDGPAALKDLETGMISSKFAEVCDLDEDGFWHLHLTNGQSLALAPSDDVEPGKAARIENGRIIVSPLRGAFRRSGAMMFWISTPDFERLMRGFDTGAIRPIRVRPD